MPGFAGICSVHHGINRHAADLFQSRRLSFLRALAPGLLRESKSLQLRQELRLQLLSRTEELNREKADLAVVQEALRAHAICDELTGLPNRASIREVLDREMARAVRDKTTLSLVLADIDYLKKINEAHGQPGGDEVLREVGRHRRHDLAQHRRRPAPSPTLWSGPRPATTPRSGG